MQIEVIKTDQIIPSATNSRTHSDAQVAQIMASIKEFGFVNPLLIDEESVIIAGHGRLNAAQKLNMTEVPCIRLEGLSSSQKKALRIADNQLALNAGWNDEILKIELEALQEAGFELDLTGFSQKDLDRLLRDPSTEGLTDEDAVPEIEHPVSAPGDVWILGAHRLVCGDATVSTDVDKCLNGVKPMLMVTDPPYGVEYDPKWRADAGVNKNKDKMGKVENDGKADWREAWALFPGDVAYVWHAGVHASTVADSLIACDFNIRSQIIWVKDRFALSRGHYHWQHEPCWYAVKKSGTGNWNGDRKQSTVWEMKSREDKGFGHGTQKPVEAMRRPIMNNSSEGQAIYEPFSGSGTTIIACESVRRSCHAIELEPKYVDIAIQRWQEYTGNEAVHEESGKKYSELKPERVNATQA